MKLNSYNLVKFSLIIVYVWFGILKILNLSPVAHLVQNSFPAFFPSSFLVILGLYEIIAGLLLINERTLKIGIVMIWLQLTGILFGAVTNPAVYFQNGNFLLPNINGEFVLKNLILLAATYYLWEKRK